MILSVGRFFDRSAGHSKKQLELVHAFRRLLDSGCAPGWELMLIGGSSHRDDYAARVREAAAGLPIAGVENGTGDEVERALAEAAVYWHGAGLDESLLGDRVRFEHFGISVVEAMSAGCVPIVYGVGGPAGIVEDGENGLHFFDVDELVEQTRLVIDDPNLRGRLADGAVRRAQDFSEEAFHDHVRAIVEDLVEAGPDGDRR
jgi:glycosyltransferase involved in cell wall biosynthesis